MREITGALAAALIWFAYLGLCHQWLKVWRGNVNPTFPRLMLWVYVGIATSYTAWGLVIGDQVLVLSYTVGILLGPLLDLQFHTPRPGLRLIGARLLALFGVALVLLVLLYQHREEAFEHRHLFGLVASGFSVANLFLVLPSQIVLLYKKGSAGSSKLYNGINLLSFGAWLAYGICSDNYWLVGTQSVGMLLQTVVFALHFRK